MGRLKDYFSFSKRERTGAIVLVILIVCVFLLPEFFPAPKVSLDAKEVAEFKRQTSELKMIENDSSGGSLTSSNSSYEKPSTAVHQKALLFDFDPNTISEGDWKKLGVSGRTIETIQKYLSKGGSFKKAEDLGKIYGLQKWQYEQLLPFVRITQRGYSKPSSSELARPPTNKNSYHHTVSPIEINEADTSTLIALPGIGSKLANRILNFRDRLGGFYSLEQVKEVYGLPDSTFQKIKPFLRCNTTQLHQININVVDVTTLKNHPYIKWNIANAIVNYRLQHGEYKSVAELSRIDIITPEVLQKLTPYLKMN